jgi:hypothetical protein
VRKAEYRELDAQVAKKVMGIPVCDKPAHTELPDRCSLFAVADHLAPDDALLRPYSTDIAAAFSVLERFAFWNVQHTPGSGWRYSVLVRLHGVTDETEGHAYAATMPLAVCYAALALLNRPEAESAAVSPPT